MAVYPLYNRIPVVVHGSWWDDYYRPLEQNLQEFRERHSGEIDAEQLADQIQREIGIWHAYSDFYGYEFFVMRARLR